MYCTTRATAVATVSFDNHTAPDQNRMNGVRIFIALRGRFGMIGTHSGPGIPVFIDHLAQPPGGDIHADARLHQRIPGDTVAGKTSQMDRIDLHLSIIDRAVVVAMDRVGTTT